MVEESTAASRNLASETSDLVELVAFFRVGEDTATPAAPLKRPAAKPPAGARPARQKIAVGGGAAPERAKSAEDWQEF
jgi:methyl-accepting chemotaxis protein